MGVLSTPVFSRNEKCVDPESLRKDGMDFGRRRKTSTRGVETGQDGVSHCGCWHERVVCHRLDDAKHTNGSGVLFGGILRVSWVKGCEWFHYTLVDADSAINAMMWQNAGKSG